MDRKDNMRTDGEGDDDTSKWGRTYAFAYEHTNLGSIINMQWHDRIDRTIDKQDDGRLTASEQRASWQAR